MLKGCKVSDISHILLLPLTTALQIHAVDFPILTHIACDVLAVPGVSIYIKWLFPSGKHTLPDSCSAMTAESTLKTVVGKEWLKKDLRVGVNYLHDVHILKVSMSLGHSQVPVGLSM